MPSSPAVERPDDSQVPVITDTRGWKHSRRGAWEALVFTAPDGTEYAEAHPMEQADFIRVWPTGLFEPMRFVKWAGSSAERKEEKTQRLATGRTRRQRAKS